MSKPSEQYQEIECKFLDIDPAKLQTKLKEIGATYKYRRLFRYYTFDYADLRLHAQKSWLRVRDEGDRTTVTFKQRLGVKEQGNDDGMKEIEIVTDSFEAATEIFKAIGMTVKFYEEKWRTMYELDGVEIVIDEYPMIPPYAEIEASSWEEVDSTATKLGLDPEQKFIFSTMQVYDRYGITQMDYKVITFDKQEKR